MAESGARRHATEEYLPREAPGEKKSFRVCPEPERKVPGAGGCQQPNTAAKGRKPSAEMGRRRRRGGVIRDLSLLLTTSVLESLVYEGKFPSL